MSETKKLMVPSVHINGTPYPELFNPVCNAGVAVREAIEALQETAPHGRDYYLQGNEALQKATSEHLARLEKLQSVLQELQDLAEGISENREVSA